MSVPCLVSLCHEIGSRVPVWNQGRGGNVSWKSDDGIMWIKASGYALGRVSHQEGLSNVRLGLFLSKLNECHDEISYAGILKDSSVIVTSLPMRSMETGLHAVLNSRYVCHFHSLPAVLMAHEQSNQPAKMRKWLDTQEIGNSVAFIGAEMPGLALANAIKMHADSSVFILKNHGVVLALPDPKSLTAWQVLESRFCHDWNYPTMTALLQLRGELAIKLAESTPISPLKLYLPDIAVYRQELTSASGTLMRDDLLELWQAVRVLHASCPELEELPRAITDAIVSLPTELARMMAATTPTKSGPMSRVKP